MPPAPDRSDLLDRIVAEGDRRKRRRLLAGTGAALVVVLALGTTALAWPEDGATDEVTVADDGETTTTERPDRSTTSSTEATTTSTSTPIEATTTTEADGTSPPPPTTTTTEPPLVCRNSTDPRCGDFRWDPLPENQPLVLDATLLTEVVQVGQEVQVRVVASDADAPIVPLASGPVQSSCAESGVFWSGGRSPRRRLCSIPLPPTPRPTGPWDPPASSGPGFVDQTLTWVYDEPGTYTIRVAASSGGDRSHTGGWYAEPYTSSASKELRVEVVAAPAG